MPRPNPRREIAAERSLARRIAFERERRGHTYDGLASRMTQHGCAVQGSALYKIEKSGRRITVDELVALARVWDLSVEELLRPVELILHEGITRVEQAEAEAWDALHRAVDDLVRARDDRAALYKRAEEGTDESLREAVAKFWELEQQRREQQNREAAERKKKHGGGLAALLERRQAEQEEWTPEQWTENERQMKIEEAVGVLVDAIFDNTDPVLGDSFGGGLH